MDADAADYIERIEDDLQMLVAGAVKMAVNRFVIGCKSDPTPVPGVMNWDALSVCALMAGWPSFQGCFHQLRGPAKSTNNNFSASDYTIDGGLKGDNASKWIYTGLTTGTLGTVPQNASFSFHTTAPEGENEQLGGANPGQAARLAFRSGTGNSKTFLVGGSRVVTVSATVAGFVGASKSSATTGMCRYGNITYAPTQAGIDEFFESPELRVFRNHTGTASWTQARISWYHFGLGLNLLTLESRVKQYMREIAGVIGRRATARPIMSRQIYRNTTDNRARIRIYNDEGLPWPGLAHDAEGLQIWYTPLGGSPVQITLSSGNWTERKHGWYEVAVPDSAYTGTAPLQFSGEITGGTVEGPEHVIVGYDPLAPAVGAATAEQVEDLAEMLTPAESTEVDKAA